MRDFKKIIKEFVCTTKCGETETNYIFYAVVVPSYDPVYRLIVSGRSFKSGIMITRNKTELFFNSKEELIKAFKYQYSLCKDNYFTKSILLKK